MYRSRAKTRTGSTKETASQPSFFMPIPPKPPRQASKNIKNRPFPMETCQYRHDPPMVIRGSTALYPQASRYRSLKTPSLLPFREKLSVQGLSFI